MAHCRAHTTRVVVPLVPTVAANDGVAFPLRRRRNARAHAFSMAPLILSLFPSVGKVFRRSYARAAPAVLYTQSLLFSLCIFYNYA